MKTKDGNNVSIEQITAANYIVPQGEERLYHIKQEIRQFNPKTGAKISVPSIQKFGPKIYKAIIEHNLLKLGYTIEVLHDPVAWLKANAAKMAEIKAEQAKAKAEKAKADKEAEKAAMKAEILAELKASGIIPGGEKKGPGRPAKDDKE